MLSVPPRGAGLPGATANSSDTASERQAQPSTCSLHPCSWTARQQLTPGGSQTERLLYLPPAPLVMGNSNSQLDKLQPEQSHRILPSPSALTSSPSPRAAGFTPKHPQKCSYFAFCSHGHGRRTESPSSKLVHQSAQHTPDASPEVWGPCLCVKPSDGFHCTCDGNLIPRVATKALSPRPASF